MHFTRGLRVQLAVVLNYAPGYQNKIEAEDKGMIPGIKLVMPMVWAVWGFGPNIQPCKPRGSREKPLVAMCADEISCQDVNQCPQESNSLFGGEWSE